MTAESRKQHLENDVRDYMIHNNIAISPTYALKWAVDMLKVMRGNATGLTVEEVIDIGTKILEHHKR